MCCKPRTRDWWRCRSRASRTTRAMIDEALARRVAASIFDAPDPSGETAEFDRGAADGRLSVLSIA
jgi:hypothetical protein